MRGEFLDLGGARIYYYAAGTRGAGNPIVLIHGFPTSSHLWSEVVPLLPAGHRVVVLDLLGYGRSDRPAGRGVDIESHCTRLVALFDELHIARACVVGHGMGGGIAQRFAVERADRTSHLCLIDSIALDGSPWLDTGMSRTSMSITDFLPPAGLSALLRHDLRRGYEDPARAARSVDLYVRPFAGPEGREALVAHLRAGRRATESIDLRRITAPTSIIWGENDRAIPLGVGIRLRDTIPEAKLNVIPGARHFTPEESEREVAEAIAGLVRR